jgi:hypothetical protein
MLAWLVAAAVSSGSPSSVAPPSAPVLVAQADDTAPADKPAKKKKKKKSDSDLVTNIDDPSAGGDKPGVITDLDAQPVGNAKTKGDAEGEAGSKSNPLQVAEGTEKVLQVPGLDKAESYDELAAEVSVHGDELHVKALSAGRTNIQATLKDGTFKTWVLEVTAAPAGAAPAAKPATATP